MADKVTLDVNDCRLIELALSMGVGFGKAHYARIKDVVTSSTAPEDIAAIEKARATLAAALAAPPQTDDYHAAFCRAIGAHEGSTFTPLEVEEYVRNAKHIAQDRSNKLDAMRAASSPASGLDATFVEIEKRWSVVIAHLEHADTLDRNSMPLESKWQALGELNCLYVLTQALSSNSRTGWLHAIEITKNALIAEAALSQSAAVPPRFQCSYWKHEGTVQCMGAAVEGSKWCADHVRPVEFSKEYVADIDTDPAEPAPVPRDTPPRYDHELINPYDRECSPCRSDCSGCAAEERDRQRKATPASPEPPRPQITRLGNPVDRVENRRDGDVRFSLERDRLIILAAPRSDLQAVLAEIEKLRAHDEQFAKAGYLRARGAIDALDTLKQRVERMVGR